MIEPTSWTDWHPNPFTVASEIADRHDLRDKLHTEILNVLNWPSIDAEQFMDDLLQEIGGQVGIVIQYRNDGMYRAAWDV